VGRSRPGETLYGQSTQCTGSKIFANTTETAAGIAPFFLLVVSKELRSTNTSNDSFGQMFFVMRASIFARFSDFLANIDHAVIAAVIASTTSFTATATGLRNRIAGADFSPHGLPLVEILLSLITARLFDAFLDFLFVEVLFFTSTTTIILPGY